MKASGFWWFLDRGRWYRGVDSTKASHRHFEAGCMVLHFFDRCISLCFRKGLIFAVNLMFVFLPPSLWHIQGLLVP